MTIDSADGDFNRTLRDLVEVQELIGEAADDDVARRRQLRDREDELRAKLRNFGGSWTDHLSIDQLQRRIADVERRLTDHYGNRLSHTSGGQSGFGGGLDPKILHRMHRAMDKSADLEALKAELVRLKNRLANLEAS